VVSAAAAAALDVTFNSKCDIKARQFDKTHYQFIRTFKKLVGFNTSQTMNYDTK